MGYEKNKTKIAKKYYMVKYKKTFLARLRCCSRQLENLFFQHVQKKHIFDLLRSFYSFISPKRILFFVRRLFAFGVLSSIRKSFLKKQLKIPKNRMYKKTKTCKNMKV